MMTILRLMRNWRRGTPPQLGNTEPEAIYRGNEDVTPTTLGPINVKCSVYF